MAALSLNSRSALFPSLNPIQGLRLSGSMQMTADRIQKFFSRIEGAFTIFSLCAGALVAFYWGIQIGLLCGACGIIGSLVFALCRSVEPALPSPSVNQNQGNQNDPNRFIPPNQALDEIRESQRQAELEFRRNVRFVGNLPLNQIPQQNFSFDLPFESLPLKQFLCRCFGADLDLGQIVLSQLNMNFQFADSSLDNNCPELFAAQVLVPGISLTFTYQDREYRVHMTRRNAYPDGLFRREPGGEEPVWNLIALNRD